MKSIFLSIYHNYPMLYVVVLLAVVLSIATLEEQYPTGESAANQVSSQVINELKDGDRVLLLGNNSEADRQWADLLQKRITKTQASVVVDRVLGENQEARRYFEELVKQSQPLKKVFTTPQTANSLLLEDLATDFPVLNSPAIIRPTSYRWPTFLKLTNIRNIANQIAPIAILAIGMTFVILTGGIDLSVGSLIALSSVIATTIIRDLAGGSSAHPFPMVLACIVAIIVSGCCGMFNGLIITKCDIPPFIATLAMMLLASGVAFSISKGESVYQIPDDFVWLGRSMIGAVPTTVLLMFALFAFAHIVLSRTLYGRHIYAIGGNKRAAWLSGIRVDGLTVSVYVISGLLAGLGGVIIASQFKSGSPTYGVMYELYVIAAVVVGGTSLQGGVGNLLGTLIGAFTIAIIQNGMNLLNVESYTQKIVLGTVILLTVVLERSRYKLTR